ncbi:DUF1858 domain-containing protein [Caldithrix abyssi]|uniref:DUF1858 domain-containing protein n=1 Tax=Caldithrix abyssi DSM 13497 TaxID=880073 RepID=H1XSP0_CALAY|nr:DUF1858 domain-containing protein [Caldithrix abyssi]APF18600.1 protein of unknown function (DUF1858) [Caldithrix abyssi DSM 13497]EHO42588.1 protein of unknown function DUF1858 [Caldithrix abyssi DSM 13497]
MAKIEADMTIEEIVEEYPELIKPMQEMGIQCMVCGEPVWGTLKDRIVEKGMQNKMTEIITQLNSLLDKK